MIFYRLHLRGGKELVVCLEKPVDRETLKKRKDVIRFHGGEIGIEPGLISMWEEIPENEKSKEKSLAYARYKGKEFYEKVARFQEINDAYMPLHKIDNIDKPQSLPNFKPKLGH